MFARDDRYIVDICSGETRERFTEACTVEMSATGVVPACPGPAFLSPGFSRSGDVRGRDYLSILRGDLGTAWGPLC
jgi:hypothetical protein